MKSRIFFLGLIACLILPAQANSLRIFTLNADEWARPRSGAVIAEFTALRSAVSYWEDGVDHSILVR
ncbi:MAG: hypothetical protein GY784_06685, partial [Gammaproteobacteria bacterium]|nr:hypothetical protein [Gammaproteobacteria bacterium]